MTNSKLNQAILRVAKSNPEFRQALQAELSKEAASEYDRLTRAMIEMFDDGMKAPLDDNKTEVRQAARKLKSAIDKLSSQPTYQNVYAVARHLHEFLIEAGAEINVL
jgi:uncharacterized protein YaaR (DUF327 family)